MSIGVNKERSNKEKLIRSTVVSAIFMVAAYIYYPFLTPYLMSKGFLKEQISTIFSVAPFILIFSGAILGKLSDELGRKRIINLSIILVIISVLLYLYMINNIFMLMIATVCSAVGVSSFQITILQKFEDNIKRRRGFLTGVFESIQSSGRLIGPLIGTVVISLLPIDYLFKISLIFFILIFIVNSVQKGKNHEKLDGEDLNFSKNIKEFWREKSLKGMGMLGIAMHATHPAQTIFIPVFILEELGGSLREVGIFATVFGLFHLTQFYSGKLCDRDGSKKIILSSIFVYAILLISMFFASNIMQLFILGAALSVAGGFWNTSAWCYMSKIGEKRKKEGTITGSYMSIAKIGAVISYLVSGFIVSIWSIKILFVLYGVFIVFALIISKKYFIPKIIE